jgi:hypothetical protein
MKTEKKLFTNSSKLLVSISTHTLSHQSAINIEINIDDAKTYLPRYVKTNKM